jgi:protein-tyrosine phosphatase
MGTVHGVYLKYVGLSAISYAGHTLLARDDDGSRVTAPELMSRLLSVATSKPHPDGILGTAPALILGYSAILNGAIALMFKTEVGMSLIGKNRKTGQIPLWSQLLFFPFHIPTRLYTYLHMRMDRGKVPVASEVQSGWWVGGCYGHQLDQDWAGVIDLTVEFPETTIARTKSYLSVPTWDGIPASPEQLEEGANFAVNAMRSSGGTGAILVHCAHGRGRSTTMMCACLVKAGLYKNWEEAFEKGIKPGRSVCKLNRRMKQALAEWQAIYVDGVGKKGV